MELQLFNQQIPQRQLFNHYRLLADTKMPLTPFANSGFRVFSQNDEDGILLYIFSLIGFTNKILLDIAFSSPIGSNSTNLLCNWGFYGLLLEGDVNGIASSRAFFKSHPDTAIFPPKIERAWVTAENINQILLENNITGEIDFFSLDVDGVDYWLWKSLVVARPRVMIVEAAAFLGREYSVAVPYQPDFNRHTIHEDFFGASIAAFIKLGKEKGYRLVACNRFGFNLFFVREDIGIGLLPEISVNDCFYFEPPDLRQLRSVRLAAVTNLQWQQV